MSANPAGTNAFATNPYGGGMGLRTADPAGNFGQANSQLGQSPPAGPGGYSPWQQSASQPLWLQSGLAQSSMPIQNYPINNFGRWGYPTTWPGQQTLPPTFQPPPGYNPPQGAGGPPTQVPPPNPIPGPVVTDPTPPGGIPPGPGQPSPGNPPGFGPFPPGQGPPQQPPFVGGGGGRPTPPGYQTSGPNAGHLDYGNGTMSASRIYNPAGMTPDQRAQAKAQSDAKAAAAQDAYRRMVGSHGYFSEPTMADLTLEETQREAQKQALTQGLLAMGFGILGNRGGNTWQALGQGGLLGLNAASQAKQDYTRGLLGAVQAQSGLDIYNQQHQARDVLKDYYAQQGQPAAPPAMPPAPQFGMQDRGTGMMPPPPAIAPQVPQGGGAVPGIGGKATIFQQYQQIGNMMAQKGLPDVAQTYFAMAEKYRPKLKNTETLTQNGQRVKVNFYDDGSQEVIPFGPDQEKAHVLDTGSQIGAVDPFTLQPIRGGGLYNKEPTPGEAQSNAIAKQRVAIEAFNADPMGMFGLNTQGQQPGAPGAAGEAPLSAARQALAGGQTHGPELLALLPQPVADQVKALAEGRQQFPAGFALKSPYWQNMISLVSAYDPNFDAINYQARAAVRKSFVEGKDAENIKAINTVMQHMDSLSKAQADLGNFGGVATPLNYVVNPAQSFFGDPRQPAVQVRTEAVANELAKVFRSTGMSETDIKNWKNAIGPNMSPAQQEAVIKSALDLVKGRMEALADKYNKGMGTTATPLQLLSPKAQEIYSRLSGEAGPAIAPVPGVQGAAPAPTMPTFKSEAEAKSAGLKPGTRIIVNGVAGTWQ